MPASALTRLRLTNQLLAGSQAQSPVKVIHWLGAVQSQDYPASMWAVGQRACVADAEVVEQAFNHGELLRTHVLRPTWHLITPADLRWMLALTATHIRSRIAPYLRKLELDPPTLSKANLTLEKALQGGMHLTRAELKPQLEQAGVLSTQDEPLRLQHILISAELDAVVCSGARRGKQHTYALLEERAPTGQALVADEALAELARRYFTSRGPATRKDFTWWAGLPAAQARLGLELVKPDLVEEVIAGQTYWLDPAARPAPPAAAPEVRLLPNYDEYIVSYTDRSAIYYPGRVRQEDTRDNFLFNHTILLDGQVVGVWKRAFRKGRVEITPDPFIPLSPDQSDALEAEMDRYSEFLRVPRAASE